MIDLYPKICNLCGGTVEYVSNAKVYGKPYGSGYCYLCRDCGAYTGTHKPRPKEALGLLANAQMRKGKMACHSLFDSMWQGKPKAQKIRKKLYCWLSNQMDIPVADCHFGYFDIDDLRKAYLILKSVQGKQMKYDNCGKIYFVEDE